MVDVLVIDGGNAVLCAASTAREAGASVLSLETAPREWRGGSSRHTCNLRYMHDVPQDVLADSYPEEEYWQDLLCVIERSTNEALTRLVIRTSSQYRDWTCQHGVNFQPPLPGALHVACTSAFFMGGGKALVNAYYRSAEQMGVQIHYNTPVQAFELHSDEPVVVLAGKERIVAKSCVLAAGGLESSHEWLREAWGQGDHGERPADNFLIRGTRFNQGMLLRFMIDAGADTIGNPSQSHCVVIDARASPCDGGVRTRIDYVSLGVVINRDADHFYGEGEDFWPKHCAIWDRLVAHQPGQAGYSIIGSKVIGHFMPLALPGAQAGIFPELARQLGLDNERFTQTIANYNVACMPGQFDHTCLGNCATAGLMPPKIRWARPIDAPPYYDYTLRPRITLTYLEFYVDGTVAVHFADKPSRDLSAAGEMMAGNVLGKGHIAGIGMSIDTTLDHIAGQRTVRAAQQGRHYEVAWEADH